MLGASLFIGWGMMEYQNFRSATVKVGEAGYYFELKPGQTLKSVARQLAEDGVIERGFYLVWLARFSGDANHIQAGEYRIYPGMTPLHILQKINRGETIQYSITVVEGWTFRQLLTELQASDQIRSTLQGQSNEKIMAALGMPGIHPEGRFLPDTYYFPKHTTDLEFLKRANHALETYLIQAWAERDSDLPYKNPEQALTMASIVEKETGIPEERPQIAGVFVRRLQKRMRLQTDPTVIYGLGDTYKGNIKRQHLQQDTPYNTYTRYGLTPTPIALPGRDAITAALHPDKGDALYFVARGDGSHVFNSSLQAHNAAVVKYQVRNRLKSYTSHPTTNIAK